MLIYGVKISDIKKYNDQKAERFFEILQKTNASNIAEKYFLDKAENDCTFGAFLSNFDDACGHPGAAACLKEIIAVYKRQPINKTFAAVIKGTQTVFSMD